MSVHWAGRPLRDGCSRCRNGTAEGVAASEDYQQRENYISSSAIINSESLKARAQVSGLEVCRFRRERSLTRALWLPHSPPASTTFLNRGPITSVWLRRRAHDRAKVQRPPRHGLFPMSPPRPGPAARSRTSLTIYLTNNHLWHAGPKRHG
ncbi:unnamed protein product [Leptosia nina]|uniref:Uncharacterized protein n=1 Tax=Leptosia nina TaxID=320188 RepID=A0AAV1J6M5_9NEOP